MAQMVCNINSVARSDEPTELPPNLAILLSRFYINVLVLWKAMSPFWFTLTALINLVSSNSRQLFFGEKALINPLYATCPAPDGKWTTLVKKSRTFSS